ncbi:hypothetical protein [Catenovulum agarivorans]|nr:hypothetical protein [Catenovulum agarivorans]
MSNIMSDPIVWGSLLGLTVVVGLCTYYVWLIITNIKNAKPPVE